jgi:exopolysaccharide biosynthesis protein
MKIRRKVRYRLKRISSSYKSHICLLLIIALAVAIAGLFSFLPGKGGGQAALPQEPGPEDKPPEHGPKESVKDPVIYTHRSETINGLKQEINILEADPRDPGVQIKPVLSHDLIYGYELLSEMAARKNAYAAVNGGFFRDYGLPSGMVVIDGALYSAATGNYPVFIIRDGKAKLSEIESELAVLYGSAAASLQEGDFERIHIDDINFPAKGKQTVVYTPAYGRTNRADRKNITVTVENGIVTRITDYEKEAPIPENGMLITFYNTAVYAGKELPIKVGDTVKLVHSPDMTGNVQAYECGCMLVKDGVSVVGESDPWVGVLTNHDPRTAVGIKEDGTVILLTVDGRQPGYSAGFTGKELADYLISLGAMDAAMLDGGASTEMLLEGRLVSRPSYKGREREMGGGILVITE